MRVRYERYRSAVVLQYERDMNALTLVTPSGSEPQRECTESAFMRDMSPCAIIPICRALLFVLKVEVQVHNYCRLRNIDLDADV